MMNCSSGFGNLNLTKSPIAEKNVILKIKLEVKIYRRYVYVQLFPEVGAPTVLVFCFSKETKLLGVRAVLTAQVQRSLGSISSIDSPNTASTWSMSGTDGANTHGADTTSTREYEQY